VGKRGAFNWVAWLRQYYRILVCCIVVVTAVLVGVFLLTRTTLAATTISWTGATSTDWNVATNWSENRVPNEADAVGITAGTNQPTINVSSASVTVAQLVVGGTRVLTVAGGNADRELHVAGVLELTDTAQITHATNTSTTQTNRLNLKVDGDASIASGASISVDAKGYAGTIGSGTGAPGSGAAPSGNFAIGGAYGGEAGYYVSASGTRGASYGSIQQPYDLGSGGRSSAAGGASAGGGSARIMVGGTLTIDGAIRSDGGLLGSNAYFATGSGGSVWIDADIVTGGGVMSANGGTQVVNSTSRSTGSGGRIAVYANTNTFSGTATAYGGAQSVGSTAYGTMGAAGTVYLKTGTAGNGQLIVDNNNTGRATQETKLLENATYDAVIARNGGRLTVPSGLKLTTNILTTSGTGTDGVATILVALTAELAVNQTATMQNTTVNVAGIISGAADITAGTSTITVQNPNYVPHITAKSLTLQTGTTVTHDANTPTTQIYRMWLAISDAVDIQSGALVDADGKGYTGAATIAAGGPGSGAATGGTYIVGGAYGGQGAWNNAATSTRGAVYGSVQQPTDAGSGGRSYSSAAASSAGGGAIRMVSGGTVTVNGTVRANGTATGANLYGAGSGGGVWIESRAVAGSGAITANGGSAVSGGMAGGGGRVALTLQTSNDFSGTLTAAGGVHTTAANQGAAGTVYVKDAQAANGKLYVTGSGTTATALTALPGTEQTLTNIYVTNGARFSIVANQTVHAQTLLTETANNILQVDSSATLDVAGAMNIKNATFAAIGAITGVPDLTIESATMEVTGGVNAPKLSLRNLSVNNGGVLTHATNTATVHSSSLSVITTGNITVAAGGSIIADGKGYAGTVGTGAGAPGSGTSGSGTYNVGGAYGGQGGFYATATATIGQSYGSVKQPTDLGSGGRASTVAAAGGGAIKLTAIGAVTNQGTISSKGADVASTASYAAGSGGSVYITAATLAGGGVISANGGGVTGTAAVTRSSGGGGRVAIYATENDTYSGTIAAYGGAATPVTAGNGAAGTVYKKVGTGTSVNGTLTVDNNDQGPAGVVAATQQLTAEVYDEVALTSGVRYSQLANSTLATKKLTADTTIFSSLSGADITVSDVVSLKSTTATWQGKLLGTADMTLDGSSVTMQTDSTAANIVAKSVALTGNSTLTHAANTTSQAYKLWLNITDNVTVDAGSTILANGLGFIAGNGPGNLLNVNAGGSYGGQGGSQTGNRGAVYGDLRQPYDIGSGGRGAGLGQAGGAIRVQAGGIITVNGSVTADGNDYASAGTNVALGSGGSVWLAASTISGSGVISTEGGSTTTTSGTDSANRASGGGGRIAVYGTRSGYTGSLSAAGGQTVHVSTQPLGGGGPGTIFLKDSNEADGTLIIKNNPSTATALPSQESGTVAYDELQVIGSSEYSIKDGDSLTIKRLRINTSGPNNRLKINSGGRLTVTESAAITEATIDLAGEWRGAGSATFGASTLLTMSGKPVDPQLQTGNLTLNNGAVFTHTTNTATVYSNALQVDVAGNMTVNNGASINVDGKGHAGTVGTGTGAPGGGSSTSGSYGIGGAYGGQSGIYLAGNAAAGQPYGSAKQPADLGSGGRSSVASGASAGGGAIKLSISGTLTQQGTVSAKGADLANTTYFATGSGGSVWIVAGKMDGSGSINANGGNINGSSATSRTAGGGGRIAIYETTKGNASGSIAAQTGTIAGTGSLVTYSGAGTVYHEAANEVDKAQLTIANSGVSTTAMTPTVAGESYNNLLVDGARSTITSGPQTFGTLTVRGTNAGLTIPSGVRVDFQTLVTGTGITIQNDGTLGTTNNSLVLPYGTWRGNGVYAFDTTDVTYGAELNIELNVPQKVKSLLIKSGAVVGHAANAATKASAIDLQATNAITVESGASINVVGKGYALNAGLGAGGSYSVSGNFGGGGSGHGSAGKIGNHALATAGGAYGDPEAPTELGSGGGRNTYSTSAGSSGGGAVKLAAGTEIVVAGSIDASGGNAPNQYVAPGSGGSIWLKAPSVSGSGSLKANAGVGVSTYAGSSAGGRIKIDQDQIKLYSVTPTSGNVGGGDSVTIVGEGFNANTVFTVGGERAANINIISDTVATFTTPVASAIGPVDVTVLGQIGVTGGVTVNGSTGYGGEGNIGTIRPDVNDATGDGILKDGYTYIQEAATLTNVTPTTGPSVGGQEVTLTGTNFVAPPQLANSWTAESSSIATANYGSQLAVVGEYVYLFGGYSSSAIQRAPISNPTAWVNTGKSLPVTDYWAQVAVIGDNIYLFGRSNYILRASVSDPTTWTNTGKTLPAALQQSQVAVVGDHVYLFGGSANVIYQASVSDPTTWTATGAQLPIALAQSQFLQIDDTLYLFGGTGSNVILSAPASNPLNWTNTGRTLPAALSGSHVLVIGEDIYLVGGTSNVIYTAKTHNPTVWTSTGKTLPAARQQAQLAVIGDKAYLFGGYTGSAVVGTIYSSPIDRLFYPGSRHNTSMPSWKTSWATNADRYTDVYFGDTPASRVRVVNGSTITALTPAGSDTVNVSVRGTQYQTQPTLANAYTYAAGPTITGVSPQTGTVNGGDTVIITGTNFKAGDIVRFGKDAATNITRVDAQTLQVVTPAHLVPETVDVTVTASDGQFATQAGAFTFQLAPPILTSVTPVSGPAIGGTTTTVKGSNFIAEARTNNTWTNTGKTLPATLNSSQTAVIGDYVYMFGGSAVVSSSTTYRRDIYRAPVTDPTAWAATGAQLPVALSGSQLAVIDNTIYLFGGSAAGTATASIYSAPVANPTSWSLASRTLPATLFNSQLEIIGDNVYLFGGSRNVVYRASLIEPLNWIDTGKTLPLFTTRASTMVIGDRVYMFGGYDSSSTIRNSVLSAPVSDPTTWINTGKTLPAAIADSTIVAVGKKVYLVGGNRNVVYGTTVDDPTIWTTAAASSGNLQRYAGIAVIGDGIYRFGGDSAALIFKTAVAGYQCNKYNKPWTTSWPTSAQCPSSNDFSIYFGDTPAKTHDVEDGQTITATTPLHSVGPVDVTLRTASGTVRDTLTNAFAFYDRPTITTITPNIAASDSGDTIDIYGTGFLTGATVSFDNEPAANVQFVDSTHLRVTLPIVAYASPVTVVVKNTDGQSGQAAGGFTFTFAAPDVTAITPDEGPVVGGTNVTITGSNFSVDSFDKVSAGTYSTCATAAGEAYCWGYNNYGQLGDGTTVNKSVPTKIAGALAGKTVSMVKTQRNTTCAVASGELYCWGYNNYGQLGDGTTVNKSVPTKVQSSVFDGKQITDLAIGMYTTCAVADGQLYCWGYNAYGQIGDSTTVVKTSPTKVAGVIEGKVVTQVRPGMYSTCAIADNEAYCWGYNGYGQIGDGTSANKSVPTKVMQAANLLQGKTITDITTERYTTCVVASGEAYCWGYNASGQLGDGSTTIRSVPVKVTQASGMLLGKTVRSINEGYGYTCATTNAEAFCWGDNGYGQLGDNTAANRTVPVKVSTIAGFRALTTGYNTTCGINDSVTYCWGYNGYGQIGDGTVVAKRIPTAVKTNFVLPSVTIDGVPATNVVRVNNGQLTATTSAAAVGLSDVAVTLRDGQAATLADGFTYVGPPEITSVTPSTGFLAGGDTVTIVGRGFIEGATVKFGDTVAQATFVDSNTITVVVPPSTSEWTVPVTVTNPDGQIATIADGYAYAYADPVVTGISPVTGPSIGGTNVTITGQNFTAPANLATTTWTREAKNLPATLSDSQLAIVDDYVYLFGGSRNVIYRAPVSDPTSWTNTGKTMPVNPNQAQVAVIGDYVYMFNSNTIYRASKTDPTTWTNTGKTLPAATSYHQLAVIGEYVYIFGGSTRATIYRAPVSDPTAWTDTGKALPNTLNFSNVSVIGDYVYLFGGSRNVIYRAPVSDPTAWTDTGKTMPINPTRGQLAVIGDYVYAIGGATNAMVQRASVSDPLTWTNLGNRLPYTLYDSKIAIIGEKIYAFGGVFGGTTQAYILSNSISGLQRNAGNRSWITSWQPSATGLSGYEALLGDQRATNVTYINSTTLQAKTPAHEEGVVNVTATAANGGTDTFDNGFMYTGPPIVTSVTPSSGTVEGGDTVTILGDKFMDGATVAFGSQVASGVQFIDSNTLVVTVPAALRSGVVALTVTNLDTQSDTLQTGYTYTAANAIIDSITPDVGPLSGGNQVTITGRYFDAKLVRAVTVTNPSDHVISDYRIQLIVNTKELIDAGKMRSDAGDLRVSSSAGVPLHYAVTASTINTNHTEIWVRVPTLAAGDSTLLLSYGNGSLTSESASLPVRSAQAGDISAQPITTNSALYLAWPGNSKNACTPNWTAGGSSITGANIVVESESGRDFGIVQYGSGTQIYNSSGSRNVQQAISPAATDLKSCMTTDSSVQRGFGVNVPTVMATGALTGTLSGSETSNISVQFDGIEAQVVSSNDTQLVVVAPAHTAVDKVDVTVKNQLALAPTTAQQAYTYTPEQLAYTNQPFVVRAGEPGQFTLEMRDKDGQAVTVGTDLTINLSSTSSGGQWSMDNDASGDWSQTNVVVPAGSSSVSFYYRDSNKGGPTITATAPNGVVATQQVAIGARYNLAISGIPDEIQASIPSSVTIQALDYTGQPQPSYVGTIHFSSSDQAAIVPQDYTFKTDDAGNATFINGLIFRTPGQWCFDAADTADADLSGQKCVTVTNPPVGTPAELRVITDEQTIPRATSSTPISIQTWDAGNADEGIAPAPAPVVTDTSVYIYTDSSTGEFSTDGVNWSGNKPFVATLLAGTTTMNVYYKDTTLGAHIMTFRDDEGTGQDFGWHNAVQQITVGASEAVALKMTNPATTRAGEWTPIDVALVDNQGDPISANRNVPLLLTSSDGEWSLSVTGVAPSTQLSARVPTGATHVVVYYRAIVTNTYDLHVVEDRDSATLTESDSSIDVTAGDALYAKFIPPTTTDLVAQTDGTYTLQFEDLYGNIAPLTDDMQISLASTNATGSFTPASPITVLAGNTATDIVYRDSTVGQVTATATFGVETDTLVLDIIPDVYAGLLVDKAPDTLIAGEVSSFNVGLVDQHGNTTTSQSATTVQLAASNGGAFSLEDEPWSVITSVTIPAGETSVTVYYKNTTAGQDVITASDSDKQATHTVQINADEPARAVFMTTPQTVTRGQMSAPITIGLQDLYGNIALAPEHIEYSLVSTSPTGEFSADGDAWTPDYTVAFDGGAATADVYYRDNVSGQYTLTLDGDEQQMITVTDAPIVSFGIDTPETVTAGDVSQVTISALDAQGNEANAVADQTIALGTVLGGEFSLSNTNWQTITSATLTAGQSNITVYYRSTAAGNETLTATDDHIAGARELTVTPADPVEARFVSGEQTVARGELSQAIVLELYDIYGNIAPASDSTIVHIGSTSDTGELSKDQTLWQDAVDYMMTQGDTQATVYYHDSTAGSYTLRAYIDDDSLAQTQAITVTPDDVSQITLETANDSVAAGVPIAVTLKAFNSDNEPTPALEDTIFQLASQLGEFSLDGANWQSVTSVTLPQGQQTLTYYYRSTAAGNDTLTATKDAITAQATIDVTPGAPTQLAFISPQQLVVKSQVSDPIVVQLRDQYGNQTNGLASTTIAMSSTGTTGQFSLDGETFATTINIPMDGQGQALLYYRNTTPATYTMTAAATGLASATQQIEILDEALPEPSKLKITAANTTKAGTIETVKIGMYNDDDQPVVAPRITEIGLSTTLGEYSRSNTNWEPITTIDFAQGQQEVTLYFRATAAGQAAMQAIGIGDGATHTMTITPNDPAAIVLAVQPASVQYGDRSGVFTVQLQDVYGNIVAAQNDTQLFIGSTHITGEFSADGISWNTAGTTTITTGSSTANFYYRDTTLGTATITVRDAELPADMVLTPATTTIDVVGNTIEKLTYTTPERTITAGTRSEAITIQLQKADGTPAIAGQDTIIELSTVAGITYYDSAANGSVVTNLVVSAGQHSATAYAYSTTAGDILMGAAVSGISTTQNLHVNAAAITQLEFATPPQTITANTPSAQIKIVAKDAFGNLATSTENIDVTLQGSLAAGEFSLDSATWQPISQLTLPSGNSELYVYYRTATIGAGTLTASASDITSADQAVAVVANAAARLGIITPVQTISAGQQSNDIVVQLQDVFGNPVVALNDTTISLASTAASGAFTPGAITIAAGSSEARFTYRDTVVGAPTLTAADPTNVLTSATQPITIQVGAPSKLVWTPQETSISATDRAEMKITLQNEFGTPAPSTTDTVISLASDQTSGSFYETSDSDSPITAITIPAGQTQATVHYNQTNVGVGILSAAAAALEKGEAEVTVYGGDIASIRFTNSPQTIAAGQISQQLTVQTFDANGNVAVVGGSLRLVLSSTAGTGEFASDSNFTQPITYVDITDGQSQASLYYRDRSIGQPTLTASADTLSASQAITVVAGTPASVNFTANTYLLERGGTTDAITFELRNQYGVVIPADIATTINLSTAASTGEYAHSPSGPWYPTFAAVVAAGQSSNTVYYRDNTTIGDTIITATGTDMTTGTAVVSSIAGDPAQLVFTTPVQEVAANQASGVIRVEMQNRYGIPTVATNDYLAQVSSSSSSASFALSPTGPWTATSVPIIAGSSTAEFYYKDARLGDATMHAEAPFGSNDQIITITTPDATYFTVSGIASPIIAGTPSDVTVCAYNELGDVASNYTGTITFSTTDTAATLPTNYTFTNADSGCRTFAGGVVLATPGTHTVQVVDGGLRGEQTNIIVEMPEDTSIARLIFVSPTAPLNLATNEISPALTLQAQNASGQSTSIGVDVQLTSDSPSGQFATDPAGPWTTTLTTRIEVGSSNLDVYYRDSTTGSHVITAKDWDGGIDNAAIENARLTANVSAFTINQTTALQTKTAIETLQDSPWLYAHTSTGDVNGSASFAFTATANNQPVDAQWQFIWRQGTDTISAGTANGSSASFAPPAITTSSQSEPFSLHVTAHDIHDNEAIYEIAVEVSPWTTQIAATSPEIYNDTALNFEGSISDPNDTRIDGTAYIQLVDAITYTPMSGIVDTDIKDNKYSGVLATNTLVKDQAYSLRVITQDTSGKTLAETLSTAITAKTGSEKQDAETEVGSGANAANTQPVPFVALSQHAIDNLKQVNTPQVRIDATTNMMLPDVILTWFKSYGWILVIPIVLVPAYAYISRRAKG
jgi:alpha-tubulin suppressor-like RCC1 family protein